MLRQDRNRALELTLAARRVNLLVLVVGLVFMKRDCQLQTQVTFPSQVEGVDQSEQVGALRRAIQSEMEFAVALHVARALLFLQRSLKRRRDFLPTLIRVTRECELQRRAL